MTNPKGTISFALILVLSLFVCCAGTTVVILYMPGESDSTGQTVATEPNDSPIDDGQRFPVTINSPSGPPVVSIGQADVHGGDLSVSCSTCHSVRPPNPDNRRAQDLDEFHGGLTFNHGSLSCLACHNRNDYDSLSLADGTKLPFENVMTLCGQCHGPQTRDYENGAHGGMTGYWDLSRGPRTRNNCIDCHDPHAPQFPMMKPTFKPRDRFLNPHPQGHADD